MYCIVLYCIIYRFNNGFTNVNNHPISIDSNHSIVSLSNPILLFMIIMIIRSKQFPINIEQILVQTYSNHHLYIIIIIIGRLDSSFVNVQYVIIGSLVIIIMMIMMIENNDWLIDWLIDWLNRCLFCILFHNMNLSNNKANNNNNDNEFVKMAQQQ